MNDDGTRTMCSQGTINRNTNRNGSYRKSTWRYHYRKNNTPKASQKDSYMSIYYSSDTVFYYNSSIRNTTPRPNSRNIVGINFGYGNLTRRISYCLDRVSRYRSMENVQKKCPHQKNGSRRNPLSGHRSL